MPYCITDVNTSVPDKKSIMMYVMCLFQSLPHSGDDIGELDLSVASDGSPVTTPGAEVFYLISYRFVITCILPRKILACRTRCPSQILEHRHHDR